MEISILGVSYALHYATREQDEMLRVGGCDGYTDTSTKIIVVRDYTDNERQEPEALLDLDAYKRKCMRHEIVHAFLYESGLSASGNNVEAWPINEEMVDWMAIQGPKLYDAWKRAGCL